MRFYYRNAWYVAPCCLTVCFCWTAARFSKNLMTNFWKSGPRWLTVCTACCFFLTVLLKYKVSRYKHTQCTASKVLFQFKIVLLMIVFFLCCIITIVVRRLFATTRNRRMKIFKTVTGKCAPLMRKSPGFSRHEIAHDCRRATQRVIICIMK